MRRIDPQLEQFAARAPGPADRAADDATLAIARERRQRLHVAERRDRVVVLLEAGVDDVEARRRRIVVHVERELGGTHPSALVMNTLCGSST